MPKKVFELAKELEMGALALVDELKSMGMSVRNHMSSLLDEDVVKALDHFKQAKVDAAKKVSKSRVRKKAVKKKDVPISNNNGPSSSSEDGGVLASSSNTINAKTTSLSQDTVGNGNVENPNKVVTVKKRSVVVRRKTSTTATEEDSSNVVNEASVEEVVMSNVHLGESVDMHQSSDEMKNASSTPVADIKPVPLPQESVTVEKMNVENIVISQNTVLKDSGITPHKNPSLEELESEIPRLKGLQVVYRPKENVERDDAKTSSVKTSSSDDDSINTKSPIKKTKTTLKRKAGAVKDSPDGKSKTYLTEKMHSFTPVYIPPKKENDSEASENKTSTTSTPKTGERTERTGTKQSYLDSDSSSSTSSTSFAEKTDSKKRLGGLAAIVAKPKTNKSREVTKLRADEELKNYSAGVVVGKVIYSNVGRKKVYTGPSKGTEITTVKESKRQISVYDGCTALELAQRLSVKFAELQNRALELNLLLKPNDYLGIKLLEEITKLYQYRVVNTAFDESAIISSAKNMEEDDAHEAGESSDHPSKKSKKSNKAKTNVAAGLERSPVVAVMGHVDHGKTTMLDAIRKTQVVKSEAGGITQHMAAYTVHKDGKNITFIDTPGHAAFSSMRERGAKVTDIVVLVVAADDGVMPQTKESVEFCKQNNVPIIVAVNKMDKEGINPDRVKQELTELELTPEDWGGDTQFVETAALKGDGIDSLLEAINLQAEMMELSATKKGPAEGVVLESKIEHGRGTVCTLLVQSGTLKKGDSIVMGETYGRARSLFDEHGNDLKSAGPSTPVQIIGIVVPPSPGDTFNVVKNEREAKKIAENREFARKELESTPVKKVASLEDFFEQESANPDQKTLKVIVRTDVSGSFEAIKNSLEKMTNDDVSVELIAGGTGQVTENDVHLAKSAKGLVLAFNVGASTTGRRLSENLGVEIRSYRVIYDLINDVKLALEGLLAPEEIETYIGRAEVRETFNIPRVGVIAGTAVLDGKIERGCSIRLLRDGKIVHEGKIDTLKRFKEDVKEVKNGFECGISILDYDNIKVKDIFEAYKIEEKKRVLDDLGKRAGL